VAVISKETLTPLGDRDGNAQLFQRLNKVAGRRFAVRNSFNSINTRRDERLDDSDVPDHSRRGLRCVLESLDKGTRAQVETVFHGKVSCFMQRDELSSVQENAEGLIELVIFFFHGEFNSLERWSSVDSPCHSGTGRARVQQQRHSDRIVAAQQTRCQEMGPRAAMVADRAFLAASVRFHPS
jgi:hypothetical protein